jgi:hypothetical protein
VTANEVAFLALGATLGLVTGAAVLEVLRGRTHAAHVVRVTVAADAIPRRRSATLSDDAFLVAENQPARGGPADRRVEELPMPISGPDRRTAVRYGPSPAGPRSGAPSETGLTWTTSAVSGSPVAPGDGPGVGIPVGSGTDPMLAALRMHALTSLLADDPERDQRGTIALDGLLAAPVLVARTDPDARTEAAPKVLRPIAAIALLDPPDESVHASIMAMDETAAPGAAPTTTTDDGSAGSVVGAPDGAPGAVDRCADERRAASERCELAVRARAGAGTADESLRAAQRAYDEHLSRADVAAAVSDARAVRREKEAAQARFRAAYATSATTDDAETAARLWLEEINDVNNAARAAAATATRERAAATKIGATLEHLSLEADAARIAAETAEAACLMARQALAVCDERVDADVAQAQPAAAPAPWAERPGVAVEEDEPLVAALTTGGTPTIFRLLRGDRDAMTRLVAQLAGTDAAEQKRWQLNIGRLVDAIVAVAIEATSLEFPPDHTFWGAFTPTQDREIAEALSSLGYRFDGLAGFVDDRIPTQRDLSLALGYAGLDPMRIRHWPTETEMAALYAEVSVAADEHLAATAGDLSLGELIALLGRRADPLAELWNEWGHVRPLLLEGA